MYGEILRRSLSFMPQYIQSSKGPPQVYKCFMMLMKT